MKRVAEQKTNSRVSEETAARDTFMGGDSALSDCSFMKHSWIFICLEVKKCKYRCYYCITHTAYCTAHICKSELQFILCFCVQSKHGHKHLRLRHARLLSVREAPPLAPSVPLRPVCCVCSIRHTPEQLWMTFFGDTCLAPGSSSRTLQWPVCHNVWVGAFWSSTRRSECCLRDWGVFWELRTCKTEVWVLIEGSLLHKVFSTAA